MVRESSLIYGRASGKATCVPFISTFIAPVSVAELSDIALKL